MRTIKLTSQNQPTISRLATQVLQQDGLVIYPTETVYGLGVDATNQAAVDKLLAYKSRREGKPLSVAVNDMAMAERYVVVNDQARALYRQFLPGPLTVVSSILPKTSDENIHRSIHRFSGDKKRSKQLSSSTTVATSSLTLANGVASEFATLGIRISSYPLVTAIVKELGRPITATSANASGQRRPYTIAHILDHLSDKQKNLIDLIIDAGELPKQPPSTVIDTTLSTPVVFRQGSLLKKRQPTTTLLSHSEADTRAIAGKLLLKHWQTVDKFPLVIGLNGPLGAGKTVFANGVAQFLGITEPLVSPTYTYMEEYAFDRHQTSGKLFHIDAWKVDTAEQWQRLELAPELQPRRIFLIEWYEQIKPWFAPALVSTKAKVIEVNIVDQGDNRSLEITEPTS